MNHAARIVERFAEQRYARDAGLVECLKKLGDRLVLVKGGDIRTRDHQRRDPARTEAQEAFEHFAFGVGEIRRSARLESALERVADILGHDKSELGANRLEPTVRTEGPTLVV